MVTGAVIASFVHCGFTGVCVVLVIDFLGFGVTGTGAFTTFNIRSLQPQTAVLIESVLAITGSGTLKKQCLFLVSLQLWFCF